MKIQKMLSPDRFGLQQKTTVFVLLPIFLILVSIGLVGMRLVRNTLLEQWQETAISKLQLTAHSVDMRLMRPKDLLLFLQNESVKDLELQSYDVVVKQLLSLDGVIQVNHEWYNKEVDVLQGEMGKGHKRKNRRYHHLERLEITTPKYDAEFKNETVTLTTYFKDENENRIGHIEVVISFYDLINEVVEAPWWKSNKAYLVGQKGGILTSTLSFGKKEEDGQKPVFGERNKLEKKTLSALQNNVSGTVFGEGTPPDEVSGFYRLSEAPWTMVVIAPGREVLQPIIVFRYFYFVIGAIGIILALFIIRLTTGKITEAIRKISDAASDLTRGNFTEPIVNTSRDEIGELIRNFNTMSQQLQKGQKLQEAMNIAQEVQQNLLPRQSYRIDGLEFDGVSIYCDETGGDYFDIIPCHENPDKLHVVVGDVVGHGIGAALLMATVRALMRCRINQAGGLSKIICDVNKLLCLDTVQAGNFVTLFFLEIDRASKKLNWIRCGHEPAIIFSLETREFSEAKGKGVALGYEPSWEYTENTLELGRGEHLILIGSDGVWDVENAKGENFGKDRVKVIMMEHSSLTPKGILGQITSEIELFRGVHPQNDDITLALIKMGGLMKSSLQLAGDTLDLELLSHKVELLAEQWLLTPKQIFEINIVLEELCVNITNHGGAAEKTVIDIAFEKDSDTIQITIADNGNPFDPTQATKVDTEQALDERSVGGLGIHLVNKYADSMEYYREGNRNVLVLRKAIK